MGEPEVDGSDAWLRLAVNVARLGLWDWNVETGQVQWSEEHFRLQGYDVGEVSPSYEAWLARLHPDDRTSAQENLKRAMDTGEEYVNEGRAIHPDGSVHWLLSRGRFLYNEQGRAVRMIGAMIETTAQHKADERQQVLIGELQHRTRNLIAVVKSISEKTTRASSSLEDFRSRFSDRLEALSRVQGLLSRHTDKDYIDLQDVVRIELCALLGDLNRVTINGVDGVRLPLSSVQTLALAIHELATNALKHGALKTESGTLEVSWQVEHTLGDDSEWLDLTWKETCGEPPSSEVVRKGMGLSLIKQALPFQLGAETSHMFEEDGVRCRIRVPLTTTDT